MAEIFSTRLIGRAGKEYKPGDKAITTDNETLTVLFWYDDIKDDPRVIFRDYYGSEFAAHPSLIEARLQKIAGANFS